MAYKILKAANQMQIQRDEFSSFEMPKDTMTLQKDYFRHDVEPQIAKMNDLAFAAKRFAALEMRNEAAECYGMACGIAESLKQKLEVLVIDCTESEAWQALERLTEHYRTQISIHMGNHELEGLIRDGVDRHMLHKERPAQ